MSMHYPGIWTRMDTNAHQWAKYRPGPAKFLTALWPKEVIRMCCWCTMESFLDRCPRECVPTWTCCYSSRILGTFVVGAPAYFSSRQCASIVVLQLRPQKKRPTQVVDVRPITNIRLFYQNIPISCRGKNRTSTWWSPAERATRFSSWETHWTTPPCWYSGVVCHTEMEIKSWWLWLYVFAWDAECHRSASCGQHLTFCTTGYRKGKTVG